MDSHAALRADRLFEVAGKWALVTGGSRGIGLGIAKGLVANGAHVIVVARKVNELQAAAAALTADGPGSAVAIGADLSSDAACKELVEKVKAHTDRLHLLVNNAGATWGDTFENFPESAWNKIMTLNVSSVFHLTRACMPLLLKGSAGAGGTAPAVVINISSVMGHSTHPGENAYSYSASKAAVSHLTRVLAAQLTPQGVNVNCIAPGFFPSKMTAYRMNEEGEAPDDLVGIHPVGRIGRESDVAGLVLYLGSRAGSFLSGAIIPCDGGFLICPSKL